MEWAPEWAWGLFFPFLPLPGAQRALPCPVPPSIHLEDDSLGIFASEKGAHLEIIPPFDRCGH